MGLYDGTTATRDTVIPPGVALVSIEATFHEDGVADVGLARTPTETLAWAYTIAHGVPVRAGQTRAFATTGPARAASAFTRHVQVSVRSTVVCYVDATGTCAADAGARAAYDRVETAVDVFGDAAHTERVFAVQSGARPYYAHLVDANDPNRAPVSAASLRSASTASESSLRSASTAPRLDVTASARGVEVHADEATFPDVPEESKLTIAMGGGDTLASVTLAHGRPIHAKRESPGPGSRAPAVLVLYDERGRVNLGAIGDPGAIVVGTEQGGTIEVRREAGAAWFGPAPPNATRLVSVPGIDIEVHAGRTIDVAARPDRAVVAAYTGKTCRVYLFAGTAPVDAPLVARARWHTGLGGAIDLVARRREDASSASFLELEPSTADRTPLLYVEVVLAETETETDGAALTLAALAAPYVDRSTVTLERRDDALGLAAYALVSPDAAGAVACTLVGSERAHDADVDVVWPWSSEAAGPERLAVPFAVFGAGAEATALELEYSPDGGPFRPTMRADATGTVRVRVRDHAVELDAAITADGSVVVRAWTDGALIARTVPVASVADAPTELYVVGTSDHWAHEMRPDVGLAADAADAHAPLIWLIGARQALQAAGAGATAYETLDLVDSDATRVVCNGEELARDETSSAPRFFRVVDVAGSDSALAVFGVPKGAVVTVTNVRAVQTRFNGSVDVTLA